MRRPAWRWLFAALLAGCPPARAACQVETRAIVPLQVAQGVPLVEVSLDGKPATFVLDTGAEYTVVADAAVRGLGLGRDPWVSTGMRGVGGVLERTANVLLRSFALGGLSLRRRSLSPALSLAVTPLPWAPLAGHAISGLLGADFLSGFDLDLDFPAGRLTLASTLGCAHGPIPWPPPHVAVSLLRARPLAFLVPVSVEGRTLEAQLDTGAALSLVSTRGAARLGVSMTEAAGGHARGVGQREIGLGRHAFATVSLGAITFPNVSLALGAPAGGYPFDMILGMDLLGRQRVLVSYATNQLLVATP